MTGSLLRGTSVMNKVDKDKSDHFRHSYYLQPVCEDDVRVHGSHIQMVYNRILQSVGTVSQHRQSFNDVRTHLQIVHVIGLPTQFLKYSPPPTMFS